MSCLCGPSQSFKGPDFLILSMGLTTVLLSPQNLQAPWAHFVLNLRARKQDCRPLARGPALFQPLPLMYNCNVVKENLGNNWIITDFEAIFKFLLMNVSVQRKGI